MNDKKKLLLKQLVTEIGVNENSSLAALDLKDYIENPTAESIQFTAELADGGELPAGIECSADGVLSGTPKSGTAKEEPYKITIVAYNNGVLPLVIKIKLSIHKAAVEGSEERPTLDRLEEFTDYWDKIAKGLPLPDIESLLTNEVRPLDIYHLLGRFATLIIWNADDLTPAEDGEIINLADASSLFNVYDFKSSLVAAPKDLYDTKRGLMDAVLTAQAMIREIKKRKWNIELAGYDKMVSAAWIETQKLNELGEGHEIEVRNYEPSDLDEDVLTISVSQ
jgi:hypothetical protein